MSDNTKPTIVIHTGGFGVECIETNIPNAQVFIIDSDVPESVDKTAPNLVDISETEEPKYVWVLKEIAHLISDETVDYYENLTTPKQRNTKNGK